MEVLIAVVMFLVATLVLFKAGDWFVSGAVGLSLRLHLPKMLVGIVIVAFSTTLPELFVSVQASFRGQPEIALGNAIGSVIADDALALALAAIVAPILVHKPTFRVAAFFLIAVSFIAYGLAADGLLNRWEGGVLVFGLLVYILYALRSAKQGRALVPVEEIQDETEDSWKRVLLLFAGGLLGVLLASYLIIESATTMATYFGVPEFVISLTLVAVGTSLPEIATVVTAARRGETEMAVGNIIGADILNILWIAGMSALVNPIEVSEKIVNFSFPVMIAVMLTMLMFLRTGWKMERHEGIVLLGMYAAFITLLFTLFGGSVN